MIYKSFSISGESEVIPDFNELIKLQFKSNNEMGRDPLCLDCKTDRQCIGKCRQPEESDELKYLMLVYSGDTAVKGQSYNSEELTQVMRRHIEQEDQRVSFQCPKPNVGQPPPTHQPPTGAPAKGEQKKRQSHRASETVYVGQEV